MRKLLYVLIVLGVLAGIAYGGRRSYFQWRTQRAVKLAREAYVKGDNEKAMLWVRAALKSDANNPEAVRMMGDFSEVAQSPSAVFWRNRLVEVEPGSAANRLLLARVAITHRDFAAADKAFKGLSDSDRLGAEFHKVYASMAVALGRFQEAEGHFSEAIRLEPGSPAAQLSLAMLRVRQLDPLKAEEGRQMLLSLAANPVVRTDALRHLTLDAVRHTNFARAVPLAAELVRQTNASTDDKLLRLNVLTSSRHPDLRPSLAALQREATSNAPVAFGLGRWMLKSTTPAETLGWLQSLRPSIQTNLPVTLVVADAYLATSNWVGLAAWVRNQSWGDLEYLRLAFNVRSMRGQGLDAAGKVEWAKVLRSTENRLDRLSALQRLTSAWGWLSEPEELLWEIVNRFPAEKEAVQTLSNDLYASGKTRSLLTLMALEHRRSPGQVDVQNNLAATALLLNAEEYRPHDLAREVYQKQPTNPSFASTYALSLYLQKQYVQALDVLRRLKPEELRNPSVAGYYGLVLAASGDTQGAKPYLDIAMRARILPEESRLFSKAKL